MTISSLPQELSALDYFFLVKEWQELCNAKIEQIYQKDHLVFLVLHVSGKGKKILRIDVPNLVYATEQKDKMPTHPPQFCTIMRKHIKGARVRKIEQKDFERIILLSLEQKERTYTLVLECIKPGNILLLNSDGKIIYPLTVQKFGERHNKGGKMYQYPEPKIHPLTLSPEKIVELLSNTKKDSLVTFLASEFSLGGRGAEELCTLTNLDKKKKPSVDDATLLHQKLHELFATDRKLNDALDLHYSEVVEKREEESQRKAHTEKKSKTATILSAQEQTRKKQEKVIDEATQKGELIYSHYAVVEEIRQTILAARKKFSTKEIKEKIKNHPIIKKYDEKTGKVTLDLK